MELWDFLHSKTFEDMLDHALEEELSKPKNTSYDDIAACYISLLHVNGIEHFGTFRFPNYEDSHKVLIDDVEYDFDSIFSHNDFEATETLCALDSRISERNEPLENILKETEKAINTSRRS